MSDNSEIFGSFLSFSHGFKDTAVNLYEKLAEINFKIADPEVFDLLTHHLFFSLHLFPLKVVTIAWYIRQANGAYKQVQCSPR